MWKSLQFFPWLFENFHISFNFFENSQKLKKSSGGPMVATKEALSPDIGLMWVQNDNVALFKNKQFFFKK